LDLLVNLFLDINHSNNFILLPAYKSLSVVADFVADGGGDDDDDDDSNDHSFCPRYEFNTIEIEIIEIQNYKNVSRLDSFWKHLNSSQQLENHQVNRLSTIIRLLSF
jgi:hypothetical protein